MSTFATCYSPRAPGLESVILESGKPRFDFVADESLEIDGVPATRQRTTCAEIDGVPATRQRTTCAEIDGTPFCSGTVRFPSLDANFRAESSTGAAEVERILGRIQIVPERIGVPGFSRVHADLQEDSGQAYLDLLREVGLTPDVRTRHIAGMPGGHVLDAKPHPGTMLRPGEVVTVTVSAEPRGPADEISLGIGTSDPDGDGDYGDFYEDEDIRSGIEIPLKLGEQI